MIYLFILILGILFSLMVYFYNLVINAKTDKTKILNAKHNKVIKNELSIMYDNWFDEQEKKDVYINSFNNLKLHAYKIFNNKKTNKWVIISHGYFGDAKQVASAAYNSYKYGINILMIEARGHGLSDGNYVGLGYHDRLDIISWIDYLIDTENNPVIELYGASMGASSTMLALGEKLPENVKCVIVDCGYTSAHEEFSYQLKKIYKLPAFPILNIFSYFIKIKNGFSLKNVDCLKALNNNNIPILFIQGNEDTFVPLFMINKLYNANKGLKKSKLIIEGAGHGGSCLINPDVYWKNVFDITDNYLN